MIVTGPEPFLNDDPVDTSTVSRKCFVVSSFVVSSSRRFAIETEEPSTFQMFAFETRPAWIATVAMATRPHQPACAIEARHLRRLFGGWIQGWGSRDTEQAFGVTPPAKTLVLSASSEKNPWAIFFFEFPIKRSPVFKFLLCDDGGLSRAHIERHSM